MKLSLTLLILFVGLLKPSNQTESFFAFLLFSSITSFFIFDSETVTSNLKKILLFSIFIIAPLFLVTTEYMVIGLIGAVLGVALTIPFINKLKQQPYLFLVLIICSFLIVSASMSKSVLQTISTIPAPESYSDDKQGFLRIFYFVEQGDNYYESLTRSHIEDIRSHTVPQDLMGWRLPTHVYLWLLFPFSGGLSIYLFFLTICSLMIIVSYLIAAVTLPGKYAILSPYLLFPYLLFASTSIEFLHTDWWAFMPFSIALYLFFINKKRFSSAFFSLALITRELYIIPFLAFCLFVLIRKKLRNILFIVAPVFIFIFAMLVHYFQVIKYTNLVISTRFHEIDLQPIFAMLSYASNKYLLVDYRVFSLVLGVSVLFFLLNYKNLNDMVKTIFLIIILQIVLYSFFGANKYSDYWGINFIPLLLIIYPVILLYDKHSNKN